MKQRGIRMAIIKKENVFLVEVEDKFALIERSAGLIHVIDASSVKLWEAGQDIEVLSTSIAIAAASGGEIPTGKSVAPGTGGFAGLEGEVSTIPEL